MAKNKLVWSLLLVLLALAGGAVWLYQSRDALLELAIRRYLPEIMGVPVQVESVRLSPFEGRARVTGLVVGNPQGFQTPYALRVAEVELRLDGATLATDLVRVHAVLVRQPQLNYEYAAGGSNLDVIQRQVERYLGAHSGTRSSPRKLVIDSFVLQGARAEVHAAALQGRALSLPVPDVLLRDIGAKAGGVAPAEAASQVLAAMRVSAAQAVQPAAWGGVSKQLEQTAGAVSDRLKGLFK